VTLTRRTVLAGLSLAPFAPRLALAAGGGERRLIVVILRGGLDGLALVPPIGDPDYRTARGALAVTDTLAFDGQFALHPALTTLAEARRDTLLVHATATPYRDRSHFDGQDVLEAGVADTGQIEDGWLARALSHLPDTRAIGIGPSLPLLLRGSPQASNWSPSRLPSADADLLARLATLYQADPLFAQSLEQARATDAVAGDMDMTAGARDGQAAADAAARFLVAPDGPRLAVLDIGGWDTHANQSATLDRGLAALNQTLASLKAGLAAVWDSTVIFGVTEFGRTVAANGTGGSDHGVGGAAFLIGGAVDGGRVITDWPGLSPSALYQGRDLVPTLNLNQVIAGVLHDHLRLSNRALTGHVLPGVQSPLSGLIRS